MMMIRWFDDDDDDDNDDDDDDLVVVISSMCVIFTLNFWGSARHTDHLTPVRLLWDNRDTMALLEPLSSSRRHAAVASENVNLAGFEVAGCFFSKMSHKKNLYWLVTRDPQNGLL